MKFPVKIRAGVIGLALCLFFFIQILSKYPAFVEKYYSNGIYPIISIVVSNLSSLVSFSISELALWVLVLFGIPFVIYRIRKLRMPIGRVLLNLITTFAIVYAWFYLFWGMNYFREPLKSKLHLDKVQVPIDSFDSTFVQIIRNGNNLNMAYSIRDFDEINDLIEQSYSDVLENLPLHRLTGSKVVKTMVANWVLNKTTTSGWFSPFFHETHVNSDMMIFELPFVMAHEKAHRLGYTNEAEANFLAYLVCVNSPDPLCRYSGYFEVMNHFFYSVRVRGGDTGYFASMLNDGIKLDMKAVRERWLSYEGFLSNISEKGYNLYLKANQIPEGVKNYSRVVDLIIRYYAKQR